MTNEKLQSYAIIIKKYHHLNFEVLKLVIFDFNLTHFKPDHLLTCP